MVAVLAALLLLFQEPKPLPDLQGFLSEFRKTLQSDRLLLSQYTFTEKDTIIQLDSNQKAKKTEVKVYEVFPGLDPEDTYRRLISTNGVPTPAKEIEKQDREQQKDVESRQRKLQNKSIAEIEQAKAKAEREDEAIMDDIFAMYDVRMLRREMIEGQPTIALSFEPKPGFKPKTREGKMAQHIAGEAWVSESDHQLVRIDAEVIDTISIGFGLLAKLHKGTRVSAERRKFNDEVWLPARVEVKASGRVLLLKGINMHQITEYSDHQKYRVETIIKLPDAQ